MSLLHASFHLRFGHPLLLFPGMSTSSILLTMCSSFILLTWPYHFSSYSVIFLDACTTLFVPLMCSFRILTESLSLCTSISASSSHLLLVVLLVLSLLTRCLFVYAYAHVTGEQVIEKENLVGMFRSFIFFESCGFEFNSIMSLSCTFRQVFTSKCIILCVKTKLNVTSYFQN